MQPRHPRRPHIRAVRRELDSPHPQPGRKRWSFRLPALLLLAVLAGGGWYLWQHRSQATGAENPSLVAVRHGSVEESVQVDALIVRKEQVVVAPAAGTVHRLASEGERVRVGAPVLSIGPAASTPAPAAPPATASTPAPARPEYDRLSEEIYRLVVALNQARAAGEWAKAASLEAQLDDLSRRQAALISQSGQASPVTPAAPAPRPAAVSAAIVGGAGVSAPFSGVVLYQTDGLEAILTPAEAARWTPSWLRTLPYPDLKQTTGQAVSAGQPLFKVVDDLDLELITVVPAGRFTPSQRTIMAQEGLAVRVDGKERALTARVRRTVEEGDELLLHLTLPMPASEALRVRRLRVTLLLETFEGIVVPRTAVDVRDGKSGVWVRDGGSYRFTPVKVVGGNRDEVAVKGDLAPDAKVWKVLPPPNR